MLGFEISGCGDLISRLPKILATMVHVYEYACMYVCMYLPIYLYNMYRHTYYIHIYTHTRARTCECTCSTKQRASTEFVSSVERDLVTSAPRRARRFRGTGGAHISVFAQSCSGTSAGKPDLAINCNTSPFSILLDESRCAPATFQS